jgi:hypothetical protein
MNRGHRARQVRRIVFRADDERLTPFAGLAVIGAIARTLGLVSLIDGELARERRAAPVKVRARGVSGGELVLALAESQLVGGECFDDIEGLRADQAGGVVAGLGAGTGRRDGPSARASLSALSHPVDRACDRQGRRAS